MAVSSLRLLICAGGTGGGVYPALAVYQALKAAASDFQQEEKREAKPRSFPSPSGFRLTVLWIGGIGGMEVEIINKEDIPYREIPAAGIHGVGIRRLPGNIWQIGRGIFSSRRILQEYQPDVLFYTGGYLAVPMAIAVKTVHFDKSRVRSLLYVPDIEPGLAIKALVRFTDYLALTDEKSASYFPHLSRYTVTGYPTRPEIASWVNQSQSREVARQFFGFSGTLPVLLVFGGSKGARSINRALLAVLPDLLKDVQVIHISGQLDWPEVDTARERLFVTSSAEEATRYKVYPYLHSEMGAALAAADLVLSRAGASTLGEFPLFSLPAILVPYPHAWRYQQGNAEYLAKKGGAVIIQDDELPTRLLPVVRDIVRDPTSLERMRMAMRGLAQPQAAHTIANLIISLASTIGGESC